MNEDHAVVPSTGGFSIATWIAKPVARPRGTVILCHGLTTGADDGGPFLPMRDSLTQRGFTVYRFDARSHGETGGSWRDLSLSGWRDDIIAVASHARQAGGESPLMLLGASFAGGPVVAAARDRGDVAAIALWNPVLDYRETYLAASRPAGAAVLATAGDPGLPDWAQFRIPWADVPFSRELIREFEADGTPRSLSDLETPVRVFHGRGDQYVPASISQAVVAKAPSASLRLYPIARHGFRGIRWLVRRESVRWLMRNR